MMIYPLPFFEIKKRFSGAMGLEKWGMGCAEYFCLKPAPGYAKGTANAFNAQLSLFLCLCLLLDLCAVLKLEPKEVFSA